jgi:hypothetical protein
LSVPYCDELGRFETISPVANAAAGVVIGAPHGTSDYGSAEVAAAVSYETGLPAVISRGFTGIQFGERGKRIRVSVPQEHTPGPDSERTIVYTGRARRVFDEYMRLLRAASGNRDPRLLIELHCWGPTVVGRSPAIEVATSGLSNDAIRAVHSVLAAAFLSTQPTGVSVPVATDGLHDVYNTAWHSKQHGSLARASTAIHIEMPLFGSSEILLRWYEAAMIRAVSSLAEVRGRG